MGTFNIGPCDCCGEEPIVNCVGFPEFRTTLRDTISWLVEPQAIFSTAAGTCNCALCNDAMVATYPGTAETNHVPPPTCGACSLFPGLAGFGLWCFLSNENLGPECANSAFPCNRIQSAAVDIGCSSRGISLSVGVACAPGDTSPNLLMATGTKTIPFPATYDQIITPHDVTVTAFSQNNFSCRVTTGIVRVTPV